MRLGIITDVHSNLVALDAMLQAFEIEKVDCICCAGDIIGIGPYPDEIVQRMMQILNLKCVLGNHELYFLNKNYDFMREEEREFHKWEHAQLSSVSEQFIAALPKRLDFEVDGITISLLHYAYDEEYLPMIQQPTFEQLELLFNGVDSQIVIYGHVHQGSVLHDHNRWFINTGSLGCPGKDKNIARGGILTIVDGSVSYDELVIPYAVEEVIKYMKDVNCPAQKTIQRIFYGIEG